MYKAKTVPTEMGFPDYLLRVDDGERRADCEALAAMMEKITDCKPVMWGTSIVGFDSYHYRYASGHEGDSCLVGFSSRKGDISVYLIEGYESPEAAEILGRLGKYKAGKACLYIRRLADIRMRVLEELIRFSVGATRLRYPHS